MDNKFTVVCHEPGFAPVMFHHDTIEAAQACLAACEADGCAAKLATDRDDAVAIWNEYQAQAMQGPYEVAVSIRERLYDLMLRLSSTDTDASHTVKALFEDASELAGSHKPVDYLQGAR